MKQPMTTFALSGAWSWAQPHFWVTTVRAAANHMIWHQRKTKKQDSTSHSGSFHVTYRCTTLLALFPALNSAWKQPESWPRPGTRGQRQRVEKMEKKIQTGSKKMTQGTGGALDRHSSERRSDSFTNDLWMIYPWTCLCPSEHQKPFKSGDAVSGDRAQPWLISHDLKVDPQDGGTAAFPLPPKPSCPLVCRRPFEDQIFKVEGLP